ncbi:hypothetical protein ICY_05269 [Bacillus cereus BAG2X1-3]|nr:hypothetical protein ICY_05269 [Bacillus cereus BAG2X1-3]
MKASTAFFNGVISKVNRDRQKYIRFRNGIRIVRVHREDR